MEGRWLPYQWMECVAHVRVAAVQGLCWITGRGAAVNRSGGAGGPA